MSSKSILKSVLIGLVASSPLVSAHTWIEQLMVLSDNGTMVGQPGYSRGNILRTSPSFSDPAMVNLIPPDGRTVNQILATDLMCKSSQTSQTQTDGSPRLQAAAGSAIALRYQENGHVTLPQNQPGKPDNRGTVYVYGTTQPSPDDSFLAIHRVWNAEGTGGDGRGVLLSTQNFDDGQCYQVNSGTISTQRQKQFPHPFDMTTGNDIWCQQDIALPENLSAGKPYTLYWVWDWPTMPGTSGFPNGKQEIYTSCMDIDITESSSGAGSKAQGFSFIQGQPIENAAIQSEFADITNPTAVSAQTIPFSASATGPAAGQASINSVSAATAPTDTAPAFLSVHTASTGGPGFQPQSSFSVLPISVVGSSGNGGNNGHSRTRNGFGQGSTAAQQAPQTATASADNGVVTLTQYHSVYETVIQTIYHTQFEKRNMPLTAAEVEIATATATSTCSKTEAAFQLRARIPFLPYRPHDSSSSQC